MASTREICGACPLKVNCLRKPEVNPYRQVTCFDGSEVKDTRPNTTAIKARIDKREGRLIYSRRLGIVKPVFSHLHAKGLRRFTLRSHRKFDTQWKLWALVHNVQKLQDHAP